MKIILKVLIILLITAMPAVAQEALNSNDIIVKMKTDLNLQEDQVTNITPIIEKYLIAFNDLQKSIEDGTINQSAIDSQRQQIQAAEDQELSAYLTANQISQWNYIRNQMQQQKSEASTSSPADTDEYSNLPKNNSPQN